MEPLLSVRSLRVWLHAKENLVKKVYGVDLSINRGETAGVVGETGGRKTGLLLQFLALTFCWDSEIGVTC